MFSALFTYSLAGVERNFDCWGHDGFKIPIKGLEEQQEQIYGGICRKYVNRK